MANKKTIADGQFLRNRNKICIRAAVEERENKLLLPKKKLLEVTEEKYLLLSTVMYNFDSFALYEGVHYFRSRNK